MAFAKWKLSRGCWFLCDSNQAQNVPAISDIWSSCALSFRSNKWTNAWLIFNPLARYLRTRAHLILSLNVPQLMYISSTSPIRSLISRTSFRASVIWFKPVLTPSSWDWTAAFKRASTDAWKKKKYEFTSNCTIQTSKAEEQEPKQFWMAATTAGAKNFFMVEPEI